jgi:hypothetical protein
VKDLDIFVSPTKGRYTRLSMLQNKAVSLGDVNSGGKTFRLICTISPIGELLLEYVDLASGAVVSFSPEYFSLDAIAAYNLYLHLKAFHSGEYEKEMEGKE